MKNAVKIYTEKHFGKTVSIRIDLRASWESKQLIYKVDFICRDTKQLESALIWKLENGSIYGEW